MKTVSLELSKQLKEAGYPQDVLNNHLFYMKLEDFDGYYHIARNNTPNNVLDKIASPSADEILDRLPWMVEKNKLHYYLNIDRMVDEGGYGIEYKIETLVEEVVLRKEGKEDLFVLHREETKVLADAAAKMWLYLEQHNLLEENHDQG